MVDFTNPRRDESAARAAFAAHLERFGLRDRPVAFHGSLLDFSQDASSRRRSLAYNGVRAMFSRRLTQPHTAFGSAAVFATMSAVTHLPRQIGARPGQFVGGPTVSFGGGFAFERPAEDNREPGQRSLHYEQARDLYQLAITHAGRGDAPIPKPAVAAANVSLEEDLRAEGRSLVEAGVCAYEVYDDAVLALWAPAVWERDGRVHRDDGPAVVWEDGEEAYAIDGVLGLPALVVTAPDKITAMDIFNEKNQEVRRILLSRFRRGQDPSGEIAWAKEMGAKAVHQDEFGTLYEFTYRLAPPDSWHTARDLKIVFVEVVNGSPEPDGTYKRYYLRCHPELRPLLPQGKLGAPQRRTARNAVASTYGLRGEEYEVMMRT